MMVNGLGVAELVDKWTKDGRFQELLLETRKLYHSHIQFWVFVLYKNVKIQTALSMPLILLQ